MNSKSSAQVGWRQMLKPRNLWKHILKVVLLSKNAKFLLQAIALQLRSQRKSLITQSVKICKIHSEWFDFFFSSKCFEAGNSEWWSFSPPSFYMVILFNSLHIWLDSTIMTSLLSVLFYQKCRLWAWLEYQNLKKFMKVFNCPSTDLLKTQKSSNMIYSHINHTK